MTASPLPSPSPVTPPATPADRLRSGAQLFARLSLQMRMVLLVGALLAAVSILLLSYFPGQMQQISREWAERRAKDVSTLVAQGVAPAVGNPLGAVNVSSILEGLTKTPEALYAVLRASDGSTVAAWNGDKAPPEVDPGGQDPIVHYLGDGRLDVVVPVVDDITKTRDLLVIGFSLDQLTTDRQKAMKSVGVVSALVFAAGLIVAFFIGMYLVRPIVELTRVTEKIIGEGDLTDLTQQIEVRSQDEVGMLAASFSKMVAKLRSIALGLQESTRLLSEAVHNLNASTAEQSKTVTRQASALQETQITAQEIKQTSLMAAQKAEEVLKLAERAETISRSGESAVEQSLGGLNDIRSRVEEIALKITQLNERTQQIGSITQTVKDLADQSNMLALNAAIEAVRSGEHGKGFGVVAREIRSLADQSIQATERVREILGDISRAIDGAVSITEKGAQRIEAGLVQVKASGENLGELSGIVHDNSGAVRQIAASVSQQNAGIAQIFQAVTELTKMMDDTVTRLEMTSNAAIVLKDASDRISELVKGFRV